MREAREEPEQLELDLEIREPAPTPWWFQVVEHETEGDQDTGWWGA